MEELIQNLFDRTIGRNPVIRCRCKAAFVDGKVDLRCTQLGHNLLVQKMLLIQAYETKDEDAIESALNRVVWVRRMKKPGILEWEAPDFKT